MISLDTAYGVLQRGSYTELISFDVVFVNFEMH